MGHPDPGDGCYGCWHRSGYRCRHDSYFTDSRTGRQFCHECVEVLVSWELDNELTEPSQLAFVAWVSPEPDEVRA